MRTSSWHQLKQLRLRPESIGGSAVCRTGFGGSCSNNHALCRAVARDSDLGTRTSKWETFNIQLSTSNADKTMQRIQQALTKTF